MSLTLYFYKVKKGTLPNFRKQEWFSIRRGYACADIADILGTKTEFNSDCYKLNEKAFRYMLTSVLGSQPNVYDYDANTEYTEFKAAMRHRKMNWEKYDLFVLNA